MTRFSLIVPTAAVLFGLCSGAMAQTQPPVQAPAENAVTAPVAPNGTSSTLAGQTPAAVTEPSAVTISPAGQAAPPTPEGAVSAQAEALVDAEPAAPQPAQTQSAQIQSPQTQPAEGVPAATEPAVTAPAAPQVSTTESVAAVGAAPAPLLPSAHDLSPMGMYEQADFVVKAVMILLAAASFLSWTVLLYKIVETAIARSRARNAARVLTRSASLASAVSELKGRRDPAAFMVQAVAEEYDRSQAAIAPSGPEGVKERAASLVHRVEVQASARLRRGMGLLATIGSVSPFVGLFGTVWGIMNSFIGIAESQTTNLAVVAPGIAEALFATAIGLVAAIPAVVIYNHFTRVIQGYKQILGDAGAATLRLLSRDIDFRSQER